MLYRFALVLMLTLGTTTYASANCACGECLGESSDELLRVWELASLEQRLYQRFDHPARLREIRDEIAFSEARIDSLRRLQREYEPFTRFRVGNPLAVTAERNRLDLLRAERQLADLRRLLSEEHRMHSTRLRWHATMVSQAAQRLAHATPPAGDGSIEIVNH
ncbi:hypothetical protein [Botrimarina hoheduenensis]|uniref:Periplasmic heavy metal sensor n=1 Tax=Botrimarina hoheduenensis TaxID=2528000 RepID=A0A5C5VZN6_9BACT|nr:hypothetical protein [Botrimarina hoheduenensis]TWT43269.1 hypothetical protein Pla111_22190 [Botrimarina hoheduenensis]